MSKRVKVELLIVQITGDDASEAANAIARANAAVASAIAKGENIERCEETARGTKTRLRLKLERPNTSPSRNT